MTDNKNENIQTINLNLGVTAEVVDLARAYLQSGAVDKEVVLKGLDILEKTVSTIATAATRKPQPTYSCQKADKWWNENKDRSRKDNSCKEQDHN